MRYNKRIEFARCARPTRKGEAPLLAAHARRWPQRGREQVNRVGLIFAFLSVVLTGCISTVERRAPVPKGGVIAVLTPGHPEKLVFGNYADAKSFIPFYGFAKQMQAMSVEPRINEELDGRGFRIEEELQLALVRDIRSKGINVRAVSVVREAEILPSALKRSEFPPAEGSWAMIDARITGYGVLAEMSGEFRPFVGVIARLVDAQSKEVLYEKRFAYNHWGGKVVRVPFEPADKWPDIESVENDPGGVEAAIRRGISKITEQIAADIGAK